MAFTSKTTAFHHLQRSTEVWIAEIDQLVPPDYGDEPQLSQTEQARLPHLARGLPQRQFIAGRALLKRVLSSHIDVPPSAWCIEPDVLGAIHIAADQNPFGLHVNLSKAGARVACIVSTVPCGVDLEDTARSIEPLRDGTGFLTAEELREMAALSGDEQRRRFFTLWCLKEAFVKTRGVGLHMNPRQMTMHLDNTDDIRVEAFRPNGGSMTDTASYRFRLFEPDDRFLLAAAHLPSAPRDITIQTLAAETP